MEETIIIFYFITEIKRIKKFNIKSTDFVRIV